MPKTTVHMIGQAHLDPVWLWRWTEGRAEALATCQSAADRLDEYPDFHFTRGESQVYEWVEREAPALFERIRARVAEGRWHPVNGMVIQPDMNVPSGESFVRQALLGKAFMREKLGVEPRVAYCVDSFGHAGTLPQILQGLRLRLLRVHASPGPREDAAVPNLLVGRAGRLARAGLSHQRRLPHARRRAGRPHRPRRPRQARGPERHDVLLRRRQPRRRPHPRPDRGHPAHRRRKRRPRHSLFLTPRRTLPPSRRTPPSCQWSPRSFSATPLAAIPW